MNRPVERTPGPGTVRSTLAIARSEVTLLRRNSTILLTSVGVPLAMTALSIVVSQGEAGTDGWAVVLGILLCLVLGSGVYTTCTLALTARRQDLYLKRLRTSEAPDTAILAGLLLPPVVGGLLQCVVAVGAVTVAGGASLPGVPILLVGVLFTLLVAVLAAVATTGAVRGTEQADAATMPFFAVFVLGAVWAGYEGTQSLAPLALPGGALMAVVRAALAPGPGGSLVAALPGFGVLLAWCLVLVLVSRRVFLWEPRR